MWHVGCPAEMVGIFVVWLRDAKLQNLLSGRRVNFQVTVEEALSTGTPSSFGNSQHDIAEQRYF